MIESVKRTGGEGFINYTRTEAHQPLFDGIYAVVIEHQYMIDNIWKSMRADTFLRWKDGKWLASGVEIEITGSVIAYIGPFERF